jgi:hypothetical protein
VYGKFSVAIWIKKNKAAIQERRESLKNKDNYTEKNGNFDQV